MERYVQEVEDLCQFALQVLVFLLEMVVLVFGGLVLLVDVLLVGLLAGVLGDDCAGGSCGFGLVGVLELGLVLELDGVLEGFDLLVLERDDLLLRLRLVLRLPPRLRLLGQQPLHLRLLALQLLHRLAQLHVLLVQLVDLRVLHLQLVLDLLHLRHDPAVHDPHPLLVEVLLLLAVLSHVVPQPLALLHHLLLLDLHLLDLAELYRLLHLLVLLLLLLPRRLQLLDLRLQREHVRLEK